MATETPDFLNLFSALSGFQRSKWFISPARPITLRHAKETVLGRMPALPTSAAPTGRDAAQIGALLPAGMRVKLREDSRLGCLVAWPSRLRCEWDAWASRMNRGIQNRRDAQYCPLWPYGGVSGLGQNARTTGGAGILPGVF